MGLKRTREYALVIAMAFLMALNYEIFVFPNSFAPAGLNGIATMIQYKLQFSIGYMNLLLNVPLCLIAIFILNRDYAAKTLAFSLAFSLFALVFKYGLVDISPYIYETPNGTSTVLAPVAAGVVNGVIYGVTIKVNASTGGTSVVGALVHHKRPEQNLMRIIFILNSSVALASYFVYDYKIEPVICCIIYSYLTSLISDRIIQGGKSQVKFEIITRDFAAMSQEIIRKTHHSATVIPAKGMFSGKETDLLICVINKHQIIKLQKIIESYPGSFAYISSVNEIYGNYNISGKKRPEKRANSEI